MDKLISLANNASETLDEQLFGKFMKNNSVQGYANISRKSYLCHSRNDKEKIIRQYYFEMKAKSSAKFQPIYCLLCL